MEATRIIMNIYVGRWDFLPREWDGINGLYEKSEEEIRAEISRQVEICRDKLGWEDDYIAIYTPAEFEETFNQDLENQLTGETYFIKFFAGGRSVLCE